MTTMLILVCDADALVDGGVGVRFPVVAGGEESTGFVIRYRGQVYGYLNRCAHVPAELDWNEGDFFESGGEHLICATHGALYTPQTGYCVGGPCRGRSLRQIAVVEKNNQVFWRPDDYVVSAPETLNENLNTTLNERNE